MTKKEKSRSFELKKAECGSCSGTRNCDILGQHRDSGDDGMMQWSTDWYLLRCRGCDHVFVQTVYSDSESINHFHDEYGEEQYEYDEVKKYWPALAKRKEPAWLSHLHGRRGERSALRDALRELYGALERDLHTLASIGIRTSFDIAAELLGIDPALTFTKKLDELVNAGHIAALDRTRLETLVEAGSASAHRGWQPSAQDVEVMTDALEHFIYNAFVAPEEKKALDAKIAEMRVNVPVRKKGNQKSSPPKLPSSNQSNDTPPTT